MANPVRADESDDSARSPKTSGKRGEGHSARQRQHQCRSKGSQTTESKPLTDADHDGDSK